MYTKEELSNHVSEMKLTYIKKIKAADRIKIMSSKDSFNVFSSFWDDDMDIQESFVILCLNRANQLVGIKCAFKGGISATITDVRIILNYLLLSGASSLIIAHNHPSGSLLPSSSDDELTMKIKQSCKTMDIFLLDHLIINSDGKYFSYADEGKL